VKPKKKNWKMPTLPRPEKKVVPNWGARKAAPFLNSSAWRRLRLMYIQAQPICEACLPEVPTDCSGRNGQIDHIISREAGGAELDPANLMTLCRSHHAKKSAMERHGMTFNASGEVGALVPADGEKERIINLLK
jgi:hypothetical protein